MHSIRKLVLLGIAALALAGLTTSSALAVQAYDTTTGTALAVGSSVNSVCTGNCSLSGSVGGISVTISCQTTTSVGTVKANPDLAGNAVASATSLVFSTCKNQSNNPCTVTTLNMPWSPDTNHGGLLATSTTAGLAGTGDTGGIQVAGAGCLPFSQTCTFKGGTAGPVGTSPYTLTNYVSGPWTNPNGSTSPPQIHIGGTPNVQTTTSCGTWVTWNADFTVRTGSVAGSGNLVGLR